MLVTTGTYTPPIRMSKAPALAFSAACAPEATCWLQSRPALTMPVTDDRFLSQLRTLGPLARPIQLERVGTRRRILATCVSKNPATWVNT